MTTIYVSNKDQLPARHERDRYMTPINLIRAALREFLPPATQSVLDIGAADGRWGQVALEFLDQPSQITGVELGPDPMPDGFTHWYNNTDFLSWSDGRSYQAVLSNPPYYIAEKIIRRAWGMLSPDGIMMMLLRINFLAGVSRAKGLWKEIPLHSAAICARRPSFYGSGTNGTDYAIYVWKKFAHTDCASTPKLTIIAHER